MEMDIVSTMCRNLAQTAQDFRNINLNLLLRLNYLAQLFPAAFNETKLCEFLLADLRKWLEQAIVAYKQHLQGMTCFLFLRFTPCGTDFELLMDFVIVIVN